MGNIVAYLAVISWPLVSVLFYKKFDRITATFCTIVGGLMILPVGFDIDFPGIPPIDKSLVSVFSALFCLRFIKRQRVRLLPITKTEKFLAVVFLTAPIITVYTNQEAIINPVGIVTAGLTYHDSVSAIVQAYIILTPFLLGMQIVRSYEDQILIFKLATIAGLVYSLLILFEVRMSPQLHSWVYGYFPHDFIQQKRYGGFRPVVFLGHGLEVAMFMVIILGAAVMQWRDKLKIQNYINIPNGVIALYLLVVLILCKSLGAIIYGIFLFVAIRWFKYTAIMRGALLLASLFLLYPLLSLSDLFPHQTLLNLAENIDPVRADSLRFRFVNESNLLEHARQKLYFGWGGWGRNRLEDSVTDGAWIIALGKYGLIGFGTIAGLAWLAVWRGYKSIRFLNSLKTKNLVAIHALIVSIVLVDQIPNASWSMWTWFLTGALAGRTIGIKEEVLSNKFNKIDSSHQV